MIPWLEPTPHLTSTPLEIYFEIILAALALLTVAVASFAAAYVIQIINSWRRWRE